MKRRFSPLPACLKLVIALSLVTGVLAPLASGPSLVYASGPYTVNVTYDGPDSNLADGICYDGVAGCPLRAAIQQAQYDGVPTNISFTADLNGSTLLLSAAHGTIVLSGDNVTVDGTGRNITLSGQNLVAGQSVLRIQGSQNTLSSVSIVDSKWDGIQVGDFAGVGSGNSNVLYNVTIYRSHAAGIYIHGSSLGGNTNSVQYSLVGAASWLDDLCTPNNGNGYDGIKIDGGASYTSIMYSRIVCSGIDGIYIDGSGVGSLSTSITDNTIGTDGSLSTLGNAADGIHENMNVTTNISGNTISGNGNHGIWLQGNNSATVRGNRIGTNTDGDTAIPNAFDGLVITDSATGNLIGSQDNIYGGNVISGNLGCGVSLSSGANNNVLDGNYIGLGSGGMVAIPNGLAGVAFNGVFNNALGSTSASVNQFISGNNREGVYAINSSLIFINFRTYIGVAGNMHTPLGNTLEGVILHETSNSSISSMKIMYNGGAGIAILGNNATGNTYAPVEVWGNTGLGIDLGYDGHTPNGSHAPPGPNNWQQYPALVAADVNGIDGSTCPGCWVQIYRPHGNPTGNAGGGSNLGYLTADPGTGAFRYDFPTGVTEVTLVACNSTDGCSEMSPVYSRAFRLAHNIMLPLIGKP